MLAASLLLFPLVLCIGVIIAVWKVLPYIGFPRGVLMPAAADAVPKLGFHRWTHATLDRPMFCVVCVKAMTGVVHAAARCELCDTYCHFSCSKLAGAGCRILYTQEATTASRMPLGVGRGAPATRKHHWVMGNLPLDSTCAVCAGGVASAYSLQGNRCAWCRRCCHTECIAQLGESCDFGELQPFIVPPNCFKTAPPAVQSTPAKQGLVRFTSWRRLPQDEIQVRVSDVPADVTPVVVFVNRGSGGQMGAKLLEVFYRLLNPLQVCDLSAGGPKRLLTRFAACPRFRILICGGDGTASWVMSALDDITLACTPSIAIMPLGTGNDLARVLKWGPGFSETPTDQALIRWLHRVTSAQVSSLDRWTVSVTPTVVPTLPRRSVANRLRQWAAARTTAPVMQPQNLIMVNYFDVGVGARVALEFHKLRQSFPQLFFSRLVNTFWYSQVGGLEILRNTCARLPQACRLECDGVPMQIAEDVQGIIILNIRSYGGGADLWGPDTADTEHNPWLPASHGDGHLEVVAVTGSFHLAQMSVGLSQARRLAQCRTLRLTLTEPLPFEVDGEPQLLQPCTIEANVKNQVIALKHNASHGIVASQLTEVLDWGQANGVLSREQHDVLVRQLAARLDALGNTTDFADVLEW